MQSIQVKSVLLNRKHSAFVKHFTILFKIKNQPSIKIFTNVVWISITKNVIDDIQVKNGIAHVKINIPAKHKSERFG